MSRYRAPIPKASPYITREGYDALQAEWREIWPRRAEVTQALAAAAAEGDRSENAEYIYRKKQLRELDRRIHYLEKRLPELKVVDACPVRTDQVCFGVWVTLEDERGDRSTWRIVGADEFDPARHWISVDSPVARALLKKSLDDEAAVRTPAGEVRYIVVDIRDHADTA